MVTVWLHRQEISKISMEQGHNVGICVRPPLRLTPSVFTKIMKPVVGIWRKMGCKANRHFMAKTKHLVVANTLENLGFVANHDFIQCLHPPRWNSSVL